MLVVRSLPLVALLTLQGCAAVRTADGERLALTSPELAAYVERVFREQNRVADELAFVLEEAAEAGEWLVAEQRLLDACQGVNELATAQRDERRLGAAHSVRAVRTVPQCEQVARSTAALLVAREGDRDSR